jgi:hypothetical protein
MAKLSASEAAFYGFNLLKRDPLTFAGVGVVFLLFAVYTTMVFLPSYFNVIEAMTAVDVRGRNGPPELAGPLLGMASFYLLLIPVFMVVLGALNRSFVFGASKGWVLGLKVGMDEVRVIVVTIVGFILQLVALYACMLVGAFAGFAAAGLSGALGMLVFAAAYLAGLALSIWVGVRLSFAGPASVAERRFVVFESWAMTKGRFWPLLRAYLIVYALLVAAFVVTGVIAMGAIAVGASGSLANVGSDQVVAFLRSPGAIAIALALAASITFVSAAGFGVAARGYREIKGGGAAASAAPRMALAA